MRSLVRLRAKSELSLNAEDCHCKQLWGVRQSRNCMRLPRLSFSQQHQSRATRHCSLLGRVVIICSVYISHSWQTMTLSPEHRRTESRHGISRKGRLQLSVWRIFQIQPFCNVLLYLKLHSGSLFLCGRLKIIPSGNQNGVLTYANVAFTQRIYQPMLLLCNMRLGLPSVLICAV